VIKFGIVGLQHN